MASVHYAYSDFNCIWSGGVAACLRSSQVARVPNPKSAARFFGRGARFARRGDPRILGLFERGATPRAGMLRSNNGDLISHADTRSVFDLGLAFMYGYLKGQAAARRRANLGCLA